MTANRWNTSVFVLALALCAAPVFAFDTGPHFDMTEDALVSLGFTPNSQSIRTVQAANFLVDFHEFMGNKMFKEVKKEIGGVKIIDQKILDPACRAKLEKVLAIGDTAMHFDDLDLPGRVAKRWDQMLAATESVAKQKAKDGDILGLLALLGMSLHNVQDFYTHSNWVEQNFGNPGIGRGVLQPYGQYPTYLSVPRAIREKLNVYSQIPEGKETGRVHGSWDSDWNQPERPGLSLNKDWTGRRYHQEAYLCAYFATIQWTRLFRSYVAETPGTWDKMLAFNLGRNFDPSQDWEFARRISFYGGHWNGNGGPTGVDALTRKTAATSPQFLIASVIEYMGGTMCLTASRSALRLEAEKLLETWAVATYKGPQDPPIPKPDQEVTFAKLEVLSLEGIDKGDGSGPTSIGNELDWYARIRFAGQSYWSCLIDEHDNFDFHKPYAPWTIIKALPKGSQDEPLTSLTVTLTTGTDNSKDDGAGTDDDIEIWLGGSTRWLPIRTPDKDKDLENGTTQTFSVGVVPDVINTQTVPLPYRVSDIRGISIRKPKHGKRGNWQFAGIEVRANGASIYRNGNVNKWLTETDKSWTATDFTPQPAKMTSDIPVVLRVMELDSIDHKDDDHEDINENPGARDVGFMYSQSGQVRGDIKAVPFTTEGHGKSDRARVKVAVTTFKGTSK